MNTYTSGLNIVSFISKNSDILRGSFRQVEFGQIILPFFILRRLECVLEPTKSLVIESYWKYNAEANLDSKLKKISNCHFYNISIFNLKKIGPVESKSKLIEYISGFSENIKNLLDQFKFATTLEKLDKADLLHLMCKTFSEIDLHPASVPDCVISNIYEHLIEKFNVEFGSDSEDFMTPPDISSLAANLLLQPDQDLFKNNQNTVLSAYDQTCGLGGFLMNMLNHIDSTDYASKPMLMPYGQELVPETHAVALSAMLLRKDKLDTGYDLSQNIKLGNTLTNDQFKGRRFHYQCSNPPFGMSWAKEAKFVENEFITQGFHGRFGAGLPKTSDSSMLFIQNLIAKLELPENGGGRGAIVLSGSPLFSGSAGSGESEIRRYILENDYLEAIVALPQDMFFRTGITTYIWLISNRKDKQRQGKVQLIDASDLGSPMRKSQGNKRRLLDKSTINNIVDLYTNFKESPISKIFLNTDFGYRKLKVLQPLRLKFKFDEESISSFQESKEFIKLNIADQNTLTNHLETQSNEFKTFTWFEKEFLKNLPIKKLNKSLLHALLKNFGTKDQDAEIVKLNGTIQPDQELTDYEYIPLNQNIEEYMAKEVWPHVPDATIDENYIDPKDGGLGLIGYEINFTRYFYVYTPPRDLDVISKEIDDLSVELKGMFADLLGRV